MKNIPKVKKKTTKKGQSLPIVKASQESRGCITVIIPLLTF